MKRAVAFPCFLLYLCLSLCLTGIRAQDCDHFNDIKNGQITYDPENEVSLAPGASATLKCLSTQFETTSTCENGNWHPPSLGSCPDPEKETDTEQETPKPAAVKRQETASEVAAASCPALAAPANSFLSYSPLMFGPYPSGTMATLNCFLGYSPVGQTAAECEGGRWTQIGSCMVVSAPKCAPVMNTAHGIINYVSGSSGPYDVGSTAELSCSFGYSVSGNSRVTCEAAGWTPAPGLGQCQEGLGTTSGINCPALTAFNGQMNYLQANPASPYASGTTAMLQCNAGYTPSGSSSSFCSNGIWSPTIGTCQAGNVFGTGTLGGLGTTPIGGLGGLGTTSGQCFAIGSFVMNGQVTYSTGTSTFGPYPAGTAATVICNSGYYVSGSSTAYCQNGQWSPTSLGTCTSSTGGTGGFGGSTGAQCFAMPAPLGGSVQYSQSMQGLGTYGQGTTASLICNPGYSVSGSSTTSCYNGQWNPITLGTCTSGGFGTTPGFGGTTGLTCMAAVSPLNGQVSYSQAAQGFGTYNQGTSATLTCYSGYVSGSSTSYCQNGMWSPTLGTCSGSTTGGFGGSTGLTCMAAVSPLNGQVSYSQSAQGFGTYNQGTSATLTCYNGFVSGSSTSYCQNGMWNPTLGTCSGSTTGLGGFGGSSGLTCMAAAAPLNGQVSYSQAAQGFGTYNQGTSATLTCYNGYVSGSSTSYCQNGMWSPTLGTCSGSTTGLGGIGGTTQCYTGVMSLNGGTVQYSNGNTLGPWTSGTTATLICNGGIAQGQTTAYCQNGIWSPSSFSGCSNSGFGGGLGGTTGGTGYCYTAMPTVIGGQVQYSSGSSFGPFPAGTSATLICTQGTAQGSISSYCQNGLWSPSMFGSCSGSTGFGGLGGFGTTTSGQQCYAMLAPLNGQIRYSTGSTFGPFQTGTSATLTCNSGYGVSGTSTAYCQNGVFNPSSLGQCVLGGGSSGFGNSGASAFSSRSATRTGGSTHNETAGHSDFSHSPSSSSVNETFSHGNASDIHNCGSNVLPLVSNGRLERSGNPHVVEVVCNTGHSSHVSQVTVFCKNGEVRTTESAICLPQGPARQQHSPKNSSDCGFPVVHVERGQMLYSSGSSYAPFAPGTVATLICEFGTQPIGGASSSTCVEGSWSQEMGSCSVPGRAANGQCGLIPRASGGNIAYSEIFNTNGPFNEGTFANLICDFGRSLSGAASTTCRGSKWEPSLGECRDPNNHSASSTEGPHNPNGAFVAPMQHPAHIRCPPIKSTNLRSTLEFTQTPLGDGNYPNSTVVRLICLENGALVSKGVGQARCMNGNWVPNLGECDLVPEGAAESTRFAGPGICQPLKSPDRGKITYIQSGKTSYQLGTTAILNCEIGYSVSGHAAMSCGPKGDWLPYTGFGKCVSNIDLVH